MSGLAPEHPAAAPLPPRFAAYIAALRDAGERPTMRAYPGLPSTPWYDALVPAAAAILEGHRTIRTLAGLAYFSRLAPRTNVTEHRGPTNLRVRIHLGSVWNESDRERIVLVVDVWHPDLGDDEVRLLDGFQRYIDYAARGLKDYWSANER